MTIYVTIGNSDDRLTQAQWANFYGEVDRLITDAVDSLGGTDAEMFGKFVTSPTGIYQSACWSFHLPTSQFPDVEHDMRESLALIAADFEQDAVAWVQGDAEFIAGRKPVETATKDRADLYGTEAKPKPDREVCKALGCEPGWPDRDCPIHGWSKS